MQGIDHLDDVGEQRQLGATVVAAVEGVSRGQEMARMAVAVEVVAGSVHLPIVTHFHTSMKHRDPSRLMHMVHLRVCFQPAACAA